MNIKEIQDLIKFVAKSGATEVDLEIDNIKISIKSPAKKRRGAITESPVSIIQKSEQSASIPETPIESTIAGIKNPPAKEEKLSGEVNDNYLTIKASMIGTFYRSSSPENPPFVNVGDTIKKGDTLGIIEAMKLFNEIESEISGKIIKVLVDNASPIEFDQPLFLVDPL